MVAHSGFQNGAQNEAKKHGLVLSDSRDLAEIVALSRKFYPAGAVQDRVAGLNQDVEALLAKYAT
jgi:hypothetical protein